MRRLLHLMFALLFVQTSFASAQTFPKFTGLVVDAANVLPTATKADLEAKLLALEKDTHRQLVVATVPDLQGYDIETYGYKLGREWGVGLRDVNNGAVLLVAPKERKVRVEVGYGLEPVITDALSSVIINQDILPRFKAGDLRGGVVAGVDALDKQLRVSPEEAKARTDAAVAGFNKNHQRAGRSGGGVPIGLIFWAMVIGFVVLSMLRRRGGTGRAYTGGTGYGGGLGGSNLPIVMWGIGEAMSSRERGGGWGAGGGWGGSDSGGDGGGSDGSWGGDGFSGGGGGSFGGGGASGSW